jgi:hypothetical protein
MRKVCSITQLLFLILILGTSSATYAQSSIFNVPSTDVIPRKTFYLEADYLAHIASYENGGFHYAGPSLIYGVRKNLEIGLNAYYTRAAEPVSAELQPNAKWQFHNDEGRGIAAAVGGVMFIPISHRAAGNTRGMIYGTVSKQFKGTVSPRFTSGAYSFVGRVEDGETRAGLLLGYEQPLNRKISFVADWYSGRNSFGYAAAGFGVPLPKNNSLYFGYNFGNAGRGNNYFSLFYAHTF